MTPFSMRDFLRWAIGRGRKDKSVFSTEQEAYEFCQHVYKETGGVTPDLLRAYQFYLKNYNHDDCPPEARHP